MGKMKIYCAACMQEIHVCICRDDPVPESSHFVFNRWGEEFMRWLRFWGFIK